MCVGEERNKASLDDGDNQRCACKLLALERRETRLVIHGERNHDNHKLSLKALIPSPEPVVVGSWAAHSVTDSSSRSSSLPTVHSAQVENRAVSSL